MLNFNWKQYIENYPDLQSAGINNEKMAIRHYFLHGKNEGRVLKINIDSILGMSNKGRFGNILFFTYIIDYIARLNNLSINYNRYDDISKLGIPLYIEGKEIYNTTYIISDNNIKNILENPMLILKKNIKIELYSYLQTPETSRYIKNLINNNKESISKMNPFNYNNNNLFVHIRLGDITDINNYPYEYYDKAVNNINFDKGYISSDSIDHKICKKLIEKYNLEVFNSNEVQTIQFGSSCKNIVLSTGTFSWYIGAFSFDSNVFFPEIKKKWHGDIFIFPEWNMISY
jgi:hypothetical protein